MTLTLILLTAVTSLIFEIGIASKWSLYRKLASANLLVNLAGSMFLSWGVGVAFGASNMVMAVAAMLSTIMTIPYYQFMLQADQNPELFEEKRKELLGYWEDVLYAWNSIKMAAKLTWWVAMLPFKAMRIIQRYVDKAVEIRTPKSEAR